MKLSDILARLVRHRCPEAPRWCVVLPPGVADCERCGCALEAHDTVFALNNNAFVRAVAPGMWGFTPRPETQDAPALYCHAQPAACLDAVRRKHEAEAEVRRLLRE